MARTRIIVGVAADRSKSLIYLGESGSEAQAAMESNTTAARFEIFENVGRIKTNPRFTADPETESSTDTEAPRRGRRPKAD